MSATIKSPSGREITFKTGLFINNEFRPAKGNNTLTTPDPSTGKTLATVSAATKADVDDAVKAARIAFNTVWGKHSTPDQRAKALFKWADLIEQNIEMLAELESLDNGKPVWMAREVDIVDSVGCLRYYAGLADKIEGKTIEQQEGVKIAITRMEPIGVCGQIIPWNYPIQMFAWKVGAALAAGNTIVMKPAEQTPLSALVLAELSRQAGFPPGVINIINGLGSVCGSSISSHMDIDKVAFTGSTSTGRTIMEAAAKSNLKKVTLELGGKSPVVVFKNSDIDQAVNWVSAGILFNHGQDCCAGSRLFLEDSIKDEFLAKLKHNFETHVVGDPFQEVTFQGPQVSKQQQEKILGFIKSGIEQGATLYSGGPERIADLPEKFKKGFYVPPTIFSDCKPWMKIVKEEIFGPVITVQTFQTEEEVIEKANATEYGLAAGIFSQNADQCWRMTSALHAGTVWCNQYVALSNAVPFGGMKQSGFGRELGIEGLKEYTVTKAIHWNFGEKAQWPIVGSKL